MDSDKSMNPFKMKKDRSPDSALLLCKIFVFDIFNIVDYFKIIFISRSTKIRIVSNFWLAGYT